MLICVVNGGISLIRFSRTNTLETFCCSIVYDFLYRLDVINLKYRCKEFARFIIDSIDLASIKKINELMRDNKKHLSRSKVTKLESKIQKEIIEALKKLGYWVIRNHTQGIKYTNGRGANPSKGQPDLMIIKNGVINFIELKTKSGKLSDHQIKWHKKAYSYGIIVHVCNSLDEVLTIFN